MDSESIEKGLSLLERLTVSNERIVEMADEERAGNYGGGPPYCPHCGTFNPQITNSGGGGPMADFLLAAMCGNCRNAFIARPEGWQVFKTQADMEAAG